MSQGVSPADGSDTILNDASRRGMPFKHGEMLKYKHLRESPIFFKNRLDAKVSLIAEITAQ